MKKGIIDRINILGGIYNSVGEDIQSKLEGISFDRSFLLKEFEDYLQDSMYSRIKEGENILEGDISYPRINYQTELFTPFKEGTKDFLENKGLISKEKVQEIIPYDDPEFIIIGSSDSWPNYYFICSADKDSENPTVYTTDHEVYFDEIEKLGTLEDFFNLFVSPEEFGMTIENLRKELKKKEE
ncbi:MAG: hypothetical protein E6772_09495 [Dysgonomonas sp.]|nr:hypothetical protein [Dysgonomonas sp.]